MRKADEARRELARQVRHWTVESLRQQLEAAGIDRAYITFENGELTLSHPRILKPVQAFFELSHDFARHEGVFIGREGKIPTLFFAFVHGTRRGLAQGGLRLKPYSSMADVLEDGLRLSQGMTRKNALAGLWWGGGKGIIPLTEAMDNPAYRTECTPERRELFEAYGRFIASVGGLYYTAEDIGTKTSDMDAILRQNRFVTCISPSLGGSGNPSPYTARGVFRSMEAAWRFLTGTDRLKGVKVAVQGAGNVGAPLIELLDDAGAHVWTCDPDPATLEAMVTRRPRVQVVDLESIYDLPVDIFAPCAVGNVVNIHTIPRLKVRLICGAANNILGEEADAERLRERGIAFVPDYLCNRMGITNCCDEWQGYLAEDVALAAERVYPDTLRVLKHARNLVITTTRAADELADIAASELNPLIGHRGRRIIDQRHRSGWAEQRAGEAPREATAAFPPIFTPELDEPGIRLRWEREGAFAGSPVEAPQAGPRLAAAPISAASRPHLGSFLSALLMDVRARAAGNGCHRLVGSDPGGLALQLAVERSLPYEREEVGRPEFVEACRDLHRSNDAAIREQLSQLGVGFDPRQWLDPLNAQGATAVRRLFFAAQDAGLLRRERRLSHHCPHCGTVRVSSDIKPTRLRTRHRYTVHLQQEGDGGRLPVLTFQPELLAGAVAVTVRADGPYADAAGGTARDGLHDRPLPILAVEGQELDTALLVPSHSRADEELARERGLALDGATAEAFDATGRVRLPGESTPLSPDEARRRVVARLGDAVTTETGSWWVHARRCRRCETLVNPYPSEELFLHLERARPALQRALHSGAVAFNDARWQRLFEERLEQIEPMCISRQQWWGNPLPDPTLRDRNGQAQEGREVLSTWFSLAAWALQGDEPIDEVFVDPDLLRRWVLPTQLIGLALTGRPAFRRVRVHGALHVVDRVLQPVEGASEKDPDEERFVYRTTLQPMRKQLGNVVEPATLIRRFGADALRLGYLLCLTAQRPEVVTLAESHLRHARRTVQRLVAKVGGLGKLAEGTTGTTPDPWWLAWCEAAGASARQAFQDDRPEDAAHLLVQTVDALSRHAERVAALPPDHADRQNLGATLRSSVTAMADAFHPLCPFLFEHLRRWVEHRGWSTEPTAPPESADALCRALLEASGGGAGAVEIASPHPEALQQLDPVVERLHTLAGARIQLTGAPQRGTATAADPYVVVRRGKLVPPLGDDPVAVWYRSLHPVDVRTEGE